MSDLRGYEPPKVEAESNTSRIVGAVVVAIAIGAIGVFSYATGMWDSLSAHTTAPRMAYNDVPPPLPPPVAPPQQSVAPPVVPADNASPLPDKVPPVRAARMHVSPRAAMHTQTVQPTESPSGLDQSAPVAPTETAPSQDTAPPATTPPTDAPAPTTPEQPAQTPTEKPAPQQ
jgi:hypothetical protein